MRNRIYRTFALGLGLMAIFAGSGLNAAELYAQKATVPFEFRVGKHVYSAGTYRLDQNYGSDIVILTNVNNGQRVQMLVPVSSRTYGGTKLTFENINGVRVLKSVS